MKKVGDYKWEQLSMWDCAPKNCVEKFVKSPCGEHIFHFYLQRVKEVVNENHLKVETVQSIEDVPEEILNWRNSDYRVRMNGKRDK